MRKIFPKFSRKQKLVDVLFNIGNYLGFVLFALICIYPFYYLIINTISANNLSAAGDIYLIPKEIHFENYKQVLSLKGLGQATFISVSRTVIGTILTVLASGFLGFMFTQKKLWARGFWYRFLIITMYFNAGLIPMYLTMRNLQLTNSFLVYILPAIVQPFNIILVKTFVESLPSSLQESAELDGAGIGTIYLRVILPLSKPILATIAIFSAVSQWNSFQDTLIYITNQRLYSLQYLLYSYLNQANSLATLIKNSAGYNHSITTLAMQQTPTSIRMTITVIVVLPILLVYPIFQKYFLKGIMIGSVKK